MGYCILVVYFFFNQRVIITCKDGASRTNGVGPTFIFFLWGDQYTIFFFRGVLSGFLQSTQRPPTLTWQTHYYYFLIFFFQKSIYFLHFFSLSLSLTFSLSTSLLLPQPILSPSFFLSQMHLSISPSHSLHYYMSFSNLKFPPLPPSLPP
jgi:hypothetical protein